MELPCSDLANGQAGGTTGKRARLSTERDL